MLKEIVWEKCGCCGGSLPVINGKADHQFLPPVKGEGYCPGYSMRSSGLCGVYAGWTRATIEAWVNKSEEDEEKRMFTAVVEARKLARRLDEEEEDFVHF